MSPSAARSHVSSGRSMVCLGHVQALGSRGRTRGRRGRPRDPVSARCYFFPFFLHPFFLAASADLFPFPFFLQPFLPEPAPGPLPAVVPEPLIVIRGLPISELARRVA